MTLLQGHLRINQHTFNLTKLLLRAISMEVDPELLGVNVSHTWILLIVEPVQCPTDSIVQLEYRMI